jgi:hypothetical protein
MEFNENSRDALVQARTTSADALMVAPAARRPVVIADANALVADAMRRTRGLFNILPFLAERGLIRLLTSEHIDERVYAKLPEACGNAHVDLAAAVHAYEIVHRPLLRLVDVGALMLEDDRVGAVQLVDMEDMPVAQLGVLLAPSLVLTRDQHLLDAGIGERDWADALVVMKELIELEEMIWGSAQAMVLTGRLAALGVTEFVRSLGRSEVALGISIGLGIAVGWEFRRDLRTASARLKQRVTPAAERVMLGLSDVFEQRNAAAQRVHGTLVAPREVETLEAALARIVVQAPAPLAAADVHARLPYDRRETVEVGDVMTALRSKPAFRLIRGRGWELGHPPEQRRRPSVVRTACLRDRPRVGLR